MIGEKSEKNLELGDNEKIIEQITTRVWRIYQYWWVIFLFPLVNSISFLNNYPFLLVVLNLSLIWLSTYLIRQRWRLTLTNKQIIARQLFPRPFTFFSQTRHFPHRHIEGLTVGPRTFKSILLIGIFVSTNLGVNLLKNGLSPEGYDLPDTLDALVLILEGVDYAITDALATGIVDGYQTLSDIAKSTQIILGIAFLVIGILIVIAAIPRRHHLQIRVRHGTDFRIYAGIPKRFWKQAYEYIYQTKTVDPPDLYKKWDFPWLEGEIPENNADLEQTIYLNRIIGLFAIGAGTWRIYGTILGKNTIFEQNLILWIILAVTDIMIAVVSVIYSKKKNEMLVTNKRIIFAQESQAISGVYGKRLYLMSDIARDDVAGFRIRKLNGFSFRYLSIGILATILAILFYKHLSLYVIILLLIAIIVIFAFVNQTYLEFNVKTKGGELWHMRHQLSNPATLMRELVGDENKVLTTLLSNRLEEKEIVDSMQIIRQEDLNLPAKIHADTKYHGEMTKAHEISEEDRKNLSREITIEDLLLNGEEIVYTTNVSRGVPRRILTLTISSFLMLVIAPMGSIPIIQMLEYDSIPVNALVPLFGIFIGIGVFIAIIAIWVRFFSLYKATLWITTDRILLSDVKRVPRLLYYLGIYRENIIEETLREEIHSTFTSRQFNQRASFRELLGHFSRGLIAITIYGICVGLTFVLLEGSTATDVLGELFYPLWIFLSVIILISAQNFIWNFGNGAVQLVRSWPRRVVNILGIGTRIQIPYASKEKADKSTYAVWSGTLRRNK